MNSEDTEDKEYTEPDDLTSWFEFVKAAGLKEGTIDDLLNVNIDDYGL
jgi:hypothetical protein